MDTDVYRVQRRHRPSIQIDGVWIGVFSHKAMKRQKRVFMYDRADSNDRVIVTALFKTHRDIDRFYNYDDVVIVGKVSKFIGRLDSM